MKNLSYVLTAMCVTMIAFSSCKKDEDKIIENKKVEDVQQTNSSDSVTKSNVKYEATGSYVYTNDKTPTPKTRTMAYVNVNYNDHSNLWEGTIYTTMRFFPDPLVNRESAAEMITFEFLGKEFPKTGTYKVGPHVIANEGVSPDSKLLEGEVAILVQGGQAVTRRDESKTVKVVNENGKITITSDDEIKVYSGLIGTLDGTVSKINVVRTTTKK